MKEEPGSDSGCTAVVAILKGRELYVANAGDSRCIVSRNGKFDNIFDGLKKMADFSERKNDKGVLLHELDFRCFFKAFVNLHLSLSYLLLNARRFQAMQLKCLLITNRKMPQKGKELRTPGAK